VLPGVLRRRAAARSIVTVERLVGT